MKVLHGTKNAVICLSATRGFNDSYSNFFSDEMIKKYGANANLIKKALWITK